MSEQMFFRPAVAFVIVFTALGLSCALAQGVPPAPAEQGGPLDSLGRLIGLRSKPVEPADFVRETRPAETNFIPVHTPRPNNHERIMTKEELRAKERELDALKASHDQIANRPPSKVAHKPLEAPAQPKGPPTRTQQGPQDIKVVIPEARR
jgi:hypothetical protein